MHQRPASRVTGWSNSSAAIHPNSLMFPVMILAIAAVALPLTGCGSQPGIRVVANPSDLALLSGRWDGEFTGDESKRSGSITFSLTSGKDTAYGDVIMTPRGSAEPLLPAEPPERTIELRSHEEVLAIRFVRIEGGDISGDLTPYRDPATDNIITTTFRGRLSGDSMEGTYIATVLQSGERRTGHWKVTRSH
jgi:hypothetical protein